MRKRFVVENETCFVTLLNQGGSKVGLCLQGATQMEEFCKAAIDAYEEILRNKGRKKKLDKLFSSPVKKS